MALAFCEMKDIYGEERDNGVRSCGDSTMGPMGSASMVMHFVKLARVTEVFVRFRSSMQGHVYFFRASVSWTGLIQ